MNDDFNTPDAITAVFDWVSEANHLLQRDVVHQAELQAVLHTFHSMNSVLRIYSEPSEELLDDEIEQLIAERVEARKTKNWVELTKFVICWLQKALSLKIRRRVCGGGENE